VSLAAAAAALGGVEWLARVRHPAEVPQDPLPPGYQSLLKRAELPAYIRETVDGHEVYRWNPSYRKSPVREAGIPVERSADRRRIVILGESSAAWLGDHASKLAQVDRVPVDVFNLGLGGCSLEQMKRRVDEAFSYEPDALVVLFGHNLLYEHGSYASYRFRRLLRRSRAASLLMHKANLRRRETPMPRGERVRELERFLDRLAARAAGSGARLVVCTVPANLHFPPNEPPPVQDEDFWEARFLLETGKAAEGMERLRAVLRADPDHPWAHFVLGDRLFHGGRPELSRPHWEKVRDMSSDRASSTLNAMLASRPGTDSLDLVGLVEREAPAGVPGWESFDDNQHVHPGVVLREAEALFELLADRGLLPRPSFRDRPPEARDFRRMAMVTLRHTSPGFTEEAMACLAGTFLGAPGGRSLGDSIRRTGWPGETKSRAFCGLAEAFWRSGRREEAFALLEQARAADPASAGPSFIEGLFRLRLGQADRAAGAFAAALELDPERPDAAFFLARLMAGPR
jgi:tetratricopeptide (TPR) repeat protein